METKKEKDMPVLKVFTAFSGYDSQCMALERLKENYPGFDYELVGWSEIDEPAIKSHNAVFPEYADRNYGDISKINWNKVPDFDLFTYSSPCFPYNAPVMTDDGIIRIASVSLGQKVLTHTNSYKRVSAIKHRLYTGNMYNIVTKSCPMLSSTDEHPFYVRKNKDSEPEWVKANELEVGMLLGIAIDKYFDNIDVSEVEDATPLVNNTSLYYLLGRTVSGFGIIDDKIRQCCKDCNLAQYYDNQLTDQDIADFMVNEDNGTGFSTDILNLKVEFLRSFLSGVEDSVSCDKIDDVYYVSREDEIQAYELAHCIAKAYEVPYEVTKNEYGFYIVSYKKNIPDYAFSDGKHIWVPIEKIDKESVIDYNVYNITVEDDNSYTVYGLACHNCQDFSICGKQRGGEEGTGTRSSLLWECKKTIEAKRPKFCILENVKALVSEKFFSLFKQWMQTVDDMGYKSTWMVLNAADYDIPQGRERVFMVSVRKDDGDDGDYSFPAPMKRTRKIEDFLMDEVPEEYYLDDRDVPKFLDLLNYTGADFNEMSTVEHNMNEKELIEKVGFVPEQPKRKRVPPAENALL